MSHILTTVFQKDGAVFANADEAFNDKNRLFSAELRQATRESTQAMMDQGILLKPIEYIWNQGNFTLTVIRTVSSHEEFLNLRAFDLKAAMDASRAAGWTVLSNTIEEA